MSRRHDAGAKGSHVMCHSCGQPETGPEPYYWPKPADTVPEEHLVGRPACYFFWPKVVLYNCSHVFIWECVKCRENKSDINFKLLLFLTVWFNDIFNLLLQKSKVAPILSVRDCRVEMNQRQLDIWLFILSDKVSRQFMWDICQLVIIIETMYRSAKFIKIDWLWSINRAIQTHSLASEIIKFWALC